MGAPNGVWPSVRWRTSRPEFAFVEDADDIPAHAHGFDIRGVELTHHDGDRSFVTASLLDGLYEYCRRGSLVDDR